MDGFYVAYMTGHAGTSMLMLVIQHGIIVGADIGGLAYDGTIRDKGDGSGFRCSVVYNVPPSTELITGAAQSAEFQRIPIQFDIPRDFASGQILQIETPLGPVNARFRKLRDL